MSLQHSEPSTAGRAGWFTIGALTASLAFIVLMFAGDYVQALGSGGQVEAKVPALIIEAK